MAFDAAWKKLASNKTNEQKSIDDKLKLVFAEINDHPFLQQFPSKAEEVAKFRIKLLNLT